MNLAAEFLEMIFLSLLRPRQDLPCPSCPLEGGTIGCIYQGCALTKVFKEGYYV
jgi:hypothetical protein